MAYRHVQPNFSKGEMSDELLARFDVSAYSAGLKRARNVIVLKYGGVTKRPGTRLVAEVHNATKPVRLVPFQFSLDQAYALEMGQGYMRPATRGGLVLHEELAITGLTNAAQARVAVAYHGYSVGDHVFFSGVEGMTEINGRYFEVVEVGQDWFCINANSLDWGTFTASTGGVTRTGAPDPDPAQPTVPPVVEVDDEPPVVSGGSGGTGRPYDPDYQVP